MRALGRCRAEMGEGEEERQDAIGINKFIGGGGDRKSNLSRVSQGVSGFVKGSLRRREAAGPATEGIKRAVAHGCKKKKPRKRLRVS